MMHTPVRISPTKQVKRVLFVYPKVPVTFWSFNHALPLLHKRAYYPPLGLLTVAGFLPAEYDIRLVDMNVKILQDTDLDWADVVFLTAMNIQVESLVDVARRCKARGLFVIAGGPFVTNSRGNFDYAFSGAEATLEACVDVFVLGEGEAIIAQFLKDFQSGSPQRIYQAPAFPSLEHTPIPRWNLIDVNDYQSLSLQYSRGCPFDCEFCDIVVLNGHRPRTKTVEQVIKELDAIYASGFRGSVFFVDDNFIGNIHKLKGEILPAIAAWQDRHYFPFTFHTEASMNLANDAELVDQMVAVGFRMVFVGIETPSEASLKECGKLQNTRLDLLKTVQFLQQRGLAVNAGFIVGFDSDDEGIFDRQIQFIQASGICLAMVGMLQPVPKTRLFARLQAEGRLVRSRCSGNNTSSELAYLPIMGSKSLLAGYRRIMGTIYVPSQYFPRAKHFLQSLRIVPTSLEAQLKLSFKQVLRIFWTVGIWKRGASHFWRLFAWAMRRKRAAIPTVLSLAVLGYHLERIARGVVKDLTRSIDNLKESTPPAVERTGVEYGTVITKARVAE